jgi:hypothetical protein
MSYTVTSLTRVIKVRYVRNITDAGHFEEEGREAEDKVKKSTAGKTGADGTGAKIYQPVIIGP